MHVSRNEVMLAALKASRGARLPNGLAEDIAGATLWLCDHNFPGLDVLYRALSAAIAADESQPRSGQGGQTRSAPGHDDLQDPPGRNAMMVYTGPSWIDLALAEPGEALRVTDVDEPWLLLGLAGHAARLYKTALSMQWDNNNATLLSTSGAVWIGRRELSTAVTITVAMPESVGEGLDIAPEKLARINQLAARTYVPASDESRLKGAGAGIVDED